MCLYGFYLRALAEVVVLGIVRVGVASSLVVRLTARAVLVMVGRRWCSTMGSL